MLGPLPPAHRAGLLIAAGIVGAALGMTWAVLAVTEDAAMPVSPGAAGILGALAAALALSLLVGLPTRRRR